MTREDKTMREKTRGKKTGKRQERNLCRKKESTRARVKKTEGGMKTGV
jgi:hypothetical protein